MICALSGQLATTPVVSPKSGAVFEKKLVESYIATAGKDPISDQPMDVSELISLRTDQPVLGEVKPPVYNSIPTMLQAFQNEWDALALETFSLRKHLSAAREDLSRALYKYDAAVRVIARLTHERDEARHALTSLSESIATANQVQNHNAGNNGNENGVTGVDTENEKVENENGGGVETEVTEGDDINKILGVAREKLFGIHKKTKFPVSISKKSTVSISEAEVLVDAKTETYVIDEKSTQAVVAGPDGTRVVTLANGEISKTISEKFRLLSYLSGPGNEPFGVCGSEIKFLHTNKSFETQEAHGLSPHPSEPYFVVVGKKSFELCGPDGPIAGVHTDKLIHASDIHVDGTLFGVAHDSNIVMYDLTSRQQVSEIPVEKGHTVTKMRFAFNGYWLVVASSGSEASKVVIFDLRKNTIIHTFSFSSGSTDFVLDPSCQVLVTENGGAMQVHLYVKKGKTWQENVSRVETTLKSLSLSSSVDQYQTDSVLRVCGLQNGQLVQYNISFP